MLSLKFICRIVGGFAHLELRKEMGPEIGKCFVTVGCSFSQHYPLSLWSSWGVYVRVHEHAGGGAGWAAQYKITVDYDEYFDSLGTGGHRRRPMLAVEFRNSS